MAGRVTLRDIANAAGLSTFTVSKALNGGTGVSQKSRDHVLSVAKDLDYVPNLAAQELRGATRSSVAVITSGTANVYYLNMINGIQRAMQAANQSVVLMDIAIQGAYDPDLEDRTIQRLLEARMSGVISTLTLKPESIERLAQWDIPVVFVDLSPPEKMAYLPSVTTDNYNASLLVGEHLIEHKFTDWLFLAYPGIWSSRKDRERGLREAARRCGAELQVVEFRQQRGVGAAGPVGRAGCPERKVARRADCGKQPVAARGARDDERTRHRRAARHGGPELRRLCLGPLHRSAFDGA